MRQGYNPYKDNKTKPLPFSHQVVIPVYIPHQKDYFKDSFQILKLCIGSILKTSHPKTFISIIDNGSCNEVSEYLQNLLNSGEIQELTTTKNIGKLNAIIKAVAGQNIPLVTITDADMLFLSNWQSETVKVFNAFPKAGVVGLIPQFLTYQNKSENLLLEHFWNKKLRFIPVKNPFALAKFYESIGWEPNYSRAKLDYILGLTAENGHIACVGSGHAVATYRRELFNFDFPLYNPYKMGGGSEQILDDLPLKYGLYRFTTYDNYAYHLGNVYEDWMQKKFSTLDSEEKELTLKETPFTKKTASAFSQFKEKLMNKALKSFKIRMVFLKHKGLPKEVRKYF
ncbi:glycosyltransferase [Christiangramia sediminis]|uniref:Glycosyltransferase n=1 Tax=Christiangramia sediminis TaxID=2881336 RepID=A0A9X1LJ68_9FLAO|nr:glycosyltransferase [Christiangramia sediminis]MCB7481333.1 glycosyltransferase [Christiangramia sediminis]